MNQLTREELRTVFESSDTYASTMLIALADMERSLDFMTWDPEALYEEIRTRLQAVTPQDNMDKLHALMLALTTDVFYTDVDAFINICNALAGEGADFKTFDPAEVDEMAWAVTEVLLNDPPDRNETEAIENPFSLEIQDYIGQQAAVEGFSRLPSMLKIGTMPTKSESNFQEAAAIGAEVFGAMWGEQESKVSEIESETRERLQALFQQIQSLPLSRADSQSWKEYAGKPLRATGRGTAQAEAGRSARPFQIGTS